MAEPEPLTLREVDIKVLVNECTELLSFQHKNITFDIQISISTHPLLDAEALKQIIINIGLNAIQAMPDGGSLIITCKRVKDELTFLFQDSGIGIASENLPHIFDPFYTTKDVGEGTGLGLAVTFSLVQRMEGRISVDSEEEKGTVFMITLPIREQQS